jgi:hypothetical protein
LSAFSTPWSSRRPGTKMLLEVKVRWGCGSAPSPGPSVQSEASPQNAARERSRVRTLRQAFLTLQAALPAVPPDTKLSKLDVLVLATSYIAHLTRTLGHELPGPAWPPFLRGLRYLHPLKVVHQPRDSVGRGFGCPKLWGKGRRRRIHWTRPCPGQR